ncbi:MAG: sugar phosphate nucleotidyltransferase, partial [Nitrososphaerales archaeon]|nr:sugar phosphate nucleotidyltransferase [Nitrososphaerales archaeon]
LIDGYSKSKAKATLLLQRITQPRMYGVAIVNEGSEVLKVERVVEKPQIPPSDWAIMPLYIFDPIIMDAISRVKPGVGGEIQLTDAIQLLIDGEEGVTAVTLNEDEIRLDIGTPETYWEALKTSYNLWKCV